MAEAGMGHVVDVDDVQYGEESSAGCQTSCRRMKLCMTLSPWVPLTAAVLTAVGLPFWSIYTNRAMVYTTDFADTLLGQRTWIVDEMTAALEWVDIIGVIVTSCIVGVALLLGVQRSYQQGARLPASRCGSPGKCCYGSFLVFAGFINSLVWLLVIVVALTIAATLVWLVWGLLLDSLITNGVQYLESPTLSATDYSAAAASAVNGFGSADGFQRLVACVESSAVPPATAEFIEAVNTVVAAANQTKLVVCPASCVNIGSFNALLEVPNSCFCNTEDFGHLEATAQDIWVSLVYAEGGLCLIGLALLWLLMHLSAEFAHARHDMRNVPILGVGDDEDYMDAPAVVYATRVSKKDSSLKARQDVDHDVDALKSTNSASHGNAPMAVPETVLNPAAADSAHADGYTYDFSVSATGEALSGSPRRVDDSQGPSEQQPLDPSSSAQIGRAYSNTAQRYAAYRLRTSSNKSVPAADSKKWVR